jgi:hypothetical protein
VEYFAIKPDNMTFDLLKFANCQITKRLITRCLFSLVALLGCLLLSMPSALASLNDDRFDGNIFALYGGNGSLVPPRVNLADTLKLHKPALLVFFLDDSSDCKQYSSTISQLQSPYGRVSNFIPINIDSLPVNTTYTPTEAGYYYQGLVPQTVLINQDGKVVFNEIGQVPYEKIDDVFREVFDLEPRSKSIELKRKSFNEINTELTP